MKAATLFSGIGAPEQARPDWHWLWHAEIEPFPAAVLAARHPGSVNLEDVSADDFAERAERAGRPDVLVFGSPCQSFSVAGKRLGLSDPRGNLALVALALVGRLRPRWFVFENVPGLLSSDSGDDFAAFLGAVAECGYSGSWRVLDARYWGLAQRRERVFFVGSLGDWRGPAAVLSLAEGLHGYPEKGREAGEDVAGALGARTCRSVGAQDADAGHLLSMCLNAHPSGGLDAESETLVPVSRSWSLDLGNLGDGGNIGWRDGSQSTHTLDCNGNIGVAHTLRADGFDASEDGTGRGTPLVPVASWNVMPTLCREPGGPGSQDWKLHAAVSHGTAVRRLTPTECERLQGFPDGYTAIQWRGKPAADGPRYKALGNSMAVPVLRWLLTRIEAHDAALRAAA
ncbi:MAG: DNA cytosine methyltransferase [Reyranellaceae bacterium]